MRGKMLADLAIVPVSQISARNYAIWKNWPVLAAASDSTLGGPTQMSLTAITFRVNEETELGKLELQRCGLADQ